MDYDIYLPLLGALLLIVLRATTVSRKCALAVFETELSEKEALRAKMGLSVLATFCELGEVLCIYQECMHLPFVKEWLGLGHWVPVVLVLLAQVVILVFVSQTFAYQLPKRKFVQLSREAETEHSKSYLKAEKNFRNSMWFIKAVNIVFFPLSVSIIFLTRLFLKWSGFDPHLDETKVTENQLLSMVEDGNESGVLDSDDVEFIKNAIGLDELSVGDIATHRTEMDFLWADDDLETWDHIIRESAHRYLPICTERVDQITGVLNANVYLRFKNPTREMVLAEAVTSPFYVPETMMADTLLKNMKKSRTYFAVVIDEYGGTRGIITLTDVLSELVGDLDEGEAAQSSGSELDVHKDGSVTVDASMELDSFAEYFHVTIEAESHTVGGWITEQYGDIPEEGTFFEIPPFKVRVTKSDPRHVIEALIIKKEEVAD